MTEKKLTYQSEIMALPPIKMLLGEVPDPDPKGKRRPAQPFGEDKTEADAKNMLTRLIGHLKNSDPTNC